MRILKKKIFFFILANLLVLAPAFGAEENPATKLGRGIVNVIASPCEYVVQTNKLMEKHDPLTAYFAGAFQGTSRMFQRIGGGIYEIVTFPLPLPKKYEPLMDPPTVVDALDDSGVLDTQQRREYY